jgi:chromosome partitioning protein
VTSEHDPEAPHSPAPSTAATYGEAEGKAGATGAPGAQTPFQRALSSHAGMVEGLSDNEPEAEAPIESLEELLRHKHPGASRALPRVIAVANQKGGVGKTTTTVNLAACLADIGYRVLVVDLDPQANATTGLGIDPRSISVSMYDVMLREVPLRECALETGYDRLRIAPSSLDLAGAEIELVPTFNRERKLRLAIESMLDELDFVFIDCPPSLGLLTVNALTAAHEVLVPIQCEYYALEGLGQLLRNVELVQRNLNDQLEVSTIALVMFDARTKLASQVADEVRSHFGDRVCRQVVPRSVRLSEAPSFGQPIIEFDPRSRGALAYRAWAQEVSGGPPNRTW